MKRTSSSFYLLLVSVLASPVAQAQAVQEDEDIGYTNRCAYLGRWGSFHLTHSSSTAAYLLGKGKYIADLSFSNEDRSFWYFTPSGGDPLTTEWAFARRRDCNGRYWVWRRSKHGKWSRYEATRAWGEGLDETKVSRTSLTLEQRVEALEEKVFNKKQSPN